VTKLLAFAVLLAVTAPAAFAADSSSGQGPAALCKEQLQAMGQANFQSTYAPNGKGKNAFGKCVSRQARQSDDNEKNAAKICKKERADLGVDAFNEEYGTNPNKKNAFGKCVSGKSKQETEAEQDDTLNAAKKCKAERMEMGVQAFNDEYGTNPNKKNAFGKCVSSTAKKQGEGDDD
jgi:hypothetical protein